MAAHLDQRRQCQPLRSWDHLTGSSATVIRPPFRQSWDHPWIHHRLAVNQLGWSHLYPQGKACPMAFMEVSVIQVKEVLRLRLREDEGLRSIAGRRRRVVGCGHATCSPASALGKRSPT
jgi:hypothetical protein